MHMNMSIAKIISLWMIFIHFEMDKIIKIEENWIFLIKEDLFTQNFAKQPYIFFCSQGSENYSLPKKRPLQSLKTALQVQVNLKTACLICEGCDRPV